MTDRRRPDDERWEHLHEEEAPNYEKHAWKRGKKKPRRRTTAAGRLGRDGGAAAAPAAAPGRLRRAAGRTVAAPDPAAASRELAALDIQDLVKLEPTVTYQDALSEMFAVDGLLLLQAANCNYQIPAKAYEYLRVQKPILALTPPDGDTGQLLANLGVAEIAPLDDTDEIKRALSTFIAKLQTASPVTLDEKTLNEHSRQYQAIQLESLLEQFTQTLSGA